MSYAVLADIEARRGDPEFAIIADLNGINKKDAAAIAAGLLDGCGKIDSALSARYALPLPAPVPEILIRINVDLMLYYVAGEWDRLTDVIQRRRDEACAELAMIAKGDMGLGANTPLRLGLGPQQDSEPRRATRTTMAGLF